MYSGFIFFVLYFLSKYIIGKCSVCSLYGYDSIRKDELIPSSFDFPLERLPPRENRWKAREISRRAKRDQRDIRFRQGEEFFAFTAPRTWMPECRKGREKNRQDREECLVPPRTFDFSYIYKCRARERKKERQNIFSTCLLAR